MYRKIRLRRYAAEINGHALAIARPGNIRPIKPSRHDLRGAGRRKADHAARSIAPLKAASDPEGRNIPWLLVAAKSKSDAGLLSKIDYIVRIATSGGVAPAEAPKSQSDLARVKYRAIYLFLRKQ